MSKRLELRAELESAGFQTLSLKEIEALDHISPKRFILGIKLQVEFGVLIYCLGSGRCEGIGNYRLRRAFPSLDLNSQARLGTLGRQIYIGDVVITLQELVSLG